tara:strand:+ start:2753 stop:3430 length:678 start_codon:yes stop_codon:yes gene_type:complete
MITFFLILKFFFSRKFNFLKKKNSKENNEININFTEVKKKGKYTEDWFSYNIKYISRFILRFKLKKKELNILELGSYEGLSSVFFLTTLKNAKITCVDPHIASEENKDKDFNSVSENFQYNTNKFKNRLIHYKSTSDVFFKDYKGTKFDLIFVDGNHHYSSVLSDANNSFKHLNKGGFIIFDDFIWNYYKDINSNPVGAIKKFLHDNFIKLKIVSISYQLIIQKI